MDHAKPAPSGTDPSGTAPCGIDHRLAAYGTLRPGEANHGVVSGAGGTWRRGTVLGRVGVGERGSALGYPVLTPDAAGDPVPVMLLESDALPGWWQRLDAFEGADYRRVPVSVAVEGGVVEAWLYAARA